MNKSTGYSKFSIKYWEIWNEPDLNGFWTGSSEEYYQMYHIISDTLKNYNSTIKIGGPCTSSVDNYNYTHGFLDYITKNNVSIDFFSWHHYIESPNVIYESSKIIRSLLDEYELYTCENINTEWNIWSFPQRDKINAKNAAFTMGCFSVFQDSYLDMAFRYRGPQENNLLMNLIGLDFSLFTYDGIYKTPALSYLAMKYMIDDCPIRLTTPLIDAKEGITYLAGESLDNTNLTFIISNFETTDTNYNLEISNLPWDSSYKIVHYLIDDNNHFEIVDETLGDSSTCLISNIIEKSTVHFIRLTNSTTYPGEGPVTSRIPLILQIKILDPLFAIISILLILAFMSG